MADARLGQRLALAALGIAVVLAAIQEVGQHVRHRLQHVLFYPQPAVGGRRADRQHAAPALARPQRGQQRALSVVAQQLPQDGGGFRRVGAVVQLQRALLAQLLFQPVELGTRNDRRFGRRAGSSRFAPPLACDAHLLAVDIKQGQQAVIRAEEAAHALQQAAHARPQRFGRLAGQFRGQAGQLGENVQMACQQLFRGEPVGGVVKGQQQAVMIIRPQRPRADVGMADFASWPTQRGSGDLAGLVLGQGQQRTQRFGQPAAGRQRGECDRIGGGVGEAQPLH